jgi:hypothetical protein
MRRIIFVFVFLFVSCGAITPKTLQQRINETPKGGTLTLTGVQTITAPLVINKPLTLNWQGLTIDATQSNGAIVIETLTQGVPLAGVTIQGVTIKGGAGHAVFIGTVKDFTLRDSLIDGSQEEAIFHRDLYGKVSSNIRIQDNTIINYTFGAIDSDDPELDGMVISGNVMRDGADGVHFVGRNATISDNQFINLSGIALTANVERFDATYIQGVVISNNVFDRIHSAGGATYAINSILSTAFDDGGMLITGNVISNMQGAPNQPCYAIRITGRALVSNNVIRGASGSETIAIAVSDDYFVNGQTYGVVSHNVIEQAQSNFDYGILFSVGAWGVADSNIIQAANFYPLVSYTDKVIVK